MKSRKKFLKKLFLLTLAGTILSTIYTHFGVFPGNLKKVVVNELESATHKKIAFDKALYLPFHGLIFYNLHVKEADQRPLFDAARFSVDIKILPFLREKKIIVSNIRLDEPIYELILEPRKNKMGLNPIKTEISGQIDVPVVTDTKKIELDDLGGGPDIFLPENVYIEQIQITNGRIAIKKTEGSQTAETLSQINVRVAFQKPPILNFDGSLKLGQKPYASVNLKGFWDLKTSRYRFFLKTDWSKIPFWLKDYQKNNFLMLLESRAQLVTELQSVGSQKAYFHTAADLKDASLQMRETLYKGHVQISAKGLFNFDTKKIERYKGSLSLLDVNILNLSPKLPEIDHAVGDVEFQPNLLTVRTMKGKYKDVPFDARGTITSFRDLLIDGEIHMSVNLEKILSLIPASQKKMLNDFDIEGACEALTTLRGSLKKSSELSTESKMALRNASFIGRKNNLRLDNLSCDLFSGKQGLKISRAHFEFLKKKYDMTLFIPKNQETPGQINLLSSDLSLKTSWRLGEGHITFEGAQATLPGISAHFSGLLYPSEKPSLNIEGQAELNLPTLACTLSNQNTWLKNAQPSGDLEGSFHFRGAWNNLMGSQISFNGQGEQINIYRNIHLDKPSLQLEMNQGALDVTHFTAGIFGGTFGLRGALDFTDPNTRFDANFYANDVNLQKLQRDLKLGNNKLSGNLILQSTLRGYLKKPESFTGRGLLSIKNGDLWETSQFKAMGNLPLVKVEGLDWVTFHEMQATFDIHDKKIITNDLSLLSDTVHLALHGAVGFDQNLDMLMDIEYTNAVFLGAADAGGLVPLVVNRASEMISQYRISGTLTKPRYDKAGSPVVTSVGKKLGNFLQGLAS